MVWLQYFHSVDECSVSTSCLFGAKNLIMSCKLLGFQELVVLGEFSHIPNCEIEWDKYVL